MATFKDFKNIDDFINFIKKNHREYAGTFSGADAFTRLGIDPTVAKDPKKLEKFLKTYTPQKGLTVKEIEHDVKALNRGLIDIEQEFRSIQHSLEKMGLTYVIRSNGAQATVMIKPIAKAQGAAKGQSQKTQQRINNIASFEMSLVDSLGQTLKSGLPAANEYVSSVRKGTNGKLEYTMTTQASMFMHEMAKMFREVSDKPEYRVQGAKDYREQQDALTKLERRIKNLRQNLNKGIDPLTLSRSEQIEAWKESDSRTMSRTGAMFRTGMGSTKHFADLLAKQFRSLYAFDHKSGTLTTKYLERDLDNMTKQLALAKSPDDLQRVFEGMGKQFSKYAINPSLWQYITTYMTGLYMSGVQRFQGRISDSAQGKVAYYDLDLPGLTQLALRGQRKNVQTTRGIGENYHSVGTGKKIRLGTRGNTPTGSAYSVAAISEASWRKALAELGIKSSTGGFALGSAILSEEYLPNFQVPEAKQFGLTKAQREEYYDRHKSTILRQAIRDYFKAQGSNKKLAKGSQVFLNKNGEYTFDVMDAGQKGKQSSHKENLSVSSKVIQEYIDRALITQYYNLDRSRGERVQAGSIQRHDNGDWIFNLERAFLGTSFKGVNEGMGTDRVNLNFVKRALIRRAAEIEGIDKKQLDEIDGLVFKTTKVEAKYLYDNFRGITDRASDIYLQEVEKLFGADAAKKTNAEKDLVKFFNKHLSVLGKWELKNGSMVLAEESSTALTDPANFLVNLGKLEKNLKKMGQTKHHLSLDSLSDKALYKIKNGEIYQTGNSLMYKNFLRFTQGGVDFNEFFREAEEGGAEYGFREMQALTRAAGILSSAKGDKFGQGLQKYLTDLYGAADMAHYAKLKDRFAWAKNITSRPLIDEKTLAADSTAIRIMANELRTTEDIADEDLSEAFQENGGVKGAFLQNALLVQKKQLERYNALLKEHGGGNKGQQWLKEHGIFSAADIKAYVQTNTPYSGENFAGQYLALPYFDLFNKKEIDYSKFSLDELLSLEYGIDPQNLVINRMLNSVARERDNVNTQEASRRMGAAIQQGFDVYNSLLNTKSGSAFLKAHKYELGNGLFSLASGTKLDTSDARFGIIMNRNDVARELKKSSKEDLETLYNYLFKPIEGAKSFDEVFAGEQTDVDKLTNSLFGQAYEGEGLKRVREAILDNMVKNGGALPALLNRFPTLLGRDVLGAKVYIGNEDDNISEGTFKISPTLWQILNGDFDGDKGLINLLFKNVSPQLLKDVDALSEIDKEKADLFYALNEGFLEGKPAKKTTVDKYNAEFKDQTQNEKVFLSQTGKQFVGQFSIIREAFSNAMHTLGLDEAAGTDADVIGGVKLMRSFMQLFEQKAISAKKAEAAQGVEESDISTNLKNFYSRYFANGNVYTQDGLKGMIDEARKMGIVGETEALFKDNETNRAVVDWLVDMFYTTGGTQSNLWQMMSKSIRVENATLKELKKAARKGLLNISEDLLLEGVKYVEEALKRSGGGKVNGTEVKDLRDIIFNANALVPGVSGYGGQLRSKEITPEEREFLKAKGIYLGGKSYKTFTDIRKDMEYQTLTDMGREFYKSLEPQIISDMIANDPTKPWTTPTGIAAAARAISPRANGYLNLEDFSKRFYDVLNGAPEDYEKYKYEDYLGFTQEMFEQQRNAFANNAMLGTDVHNQIELMRHLYTNAKYGGLFDDKGNLTNDISKIIGALDENDPIEKGYINALTELQKKTKLLWGDEYSRNGYLSNVWNLAQGQFNLNKQLAGPKVENLLGNELVFAGNTGRQNLSGRIDAAILGEDNNLWLVDYKQHKGGKPTASDALQLMIYQQQYEAFRKAYGDTITGNGQHNIFETFKAQYNADEKFKKHFGRLGLEETDSIDRYRRFIETLFEKDSNGDFAHEIRMALSVADTDTGHISLLKDMIGDNSTKQLQRGGILSMAYLHPELLQSEAAQDFLLNAFGAAPFQTDVEVKRLSNEELTKTEQEGLKAYEQALKSLQEEIRKTAELQEELTKRAQQFGEKAEVVQDYNQALKDQQAILEQAQKAVDKIVEDYKLDPNRVGGQMNDLRTAVTGELTKGASLEAGRKKAAQAEALEKQFFQSLNAYQQAQEAVWKVEKFRNKAKTIGQRELADMRAEVANEDLDQAKAGLAGTMEQMKAAGIDINSPKYQEALGRAEKMLDISYKQNVQLTEQKSLFGKLADGIKMSMSRMFSFGMIGYRIVGKVSQAFQKVIGYAQQLDQAMVNIQIVTGKTREEAFNLMGTYNKLAKELGSTTTEVANSANVWFNESRDHIKPL